MAAAVCFASAEAHYSYIFRRDAQFNQIDLSGEVILKHNVSPTDSTLTFGNTEIPLAAIEYIDFRQTDIPTLRFTIPDHPDYGWAPDKTTYLDASLDIDGGGMVDNSEGLQLTVKGRGNSTWNMPKQPLRLKFSAKTSICGLQKAKSYVLLSNYIDHTHIRNAVSLWLAKRLGMEFAVNYIPCNVYFNGNYCGLYLLTDKIGITKASVNIDENTGILFEASKEFDDKFKFQSATMDQPIMVKDPNFDELYAADSMGLAPAERLALWANDLAIAEQKISEGKGNEAFDLESAVNYYLTMDFARNSEIGYPKSVYFYKRDLNPDSLYYFGPAWDFDVAYNTIGSANLAETDPAQPLWKMRYFYYLEDIPEFQELYVERLTELATSIYPELYDWIRTYAKMIEPAARLDGLRWPETTSVGNWTNRISSFNTDLHPAGLLNWINKRLDYLLREAGINIDFQPQTIPSVALEQITQPKNRKFNIIGNDGKIKSFNLNNELSLRIADGEVNIKSDEGEYTCSLTDICRMDYSNHEDSEISDAEVTTRIEIIHKSLLIVPKKLSTISIFDLRGRQILTTACGSEGISIDLSTLSDGIYILTINGIVNQKFIIHNR